MPILGSRNTNARPSAQRTLQTPEQQDANKTANSKASPNDLLVPLPPGSDGISSLAFSPNAHNVLCSSNWDGTLRFWEVSWDPSGQLVAVPKAEAKHENSAPVLCSAFSSDGNSVISGGADNAVRMYQLGQRLPPHGIPQQIGNHDAPVRHVGFSSITNLAISGSWDKTVKLWDARSSKPAAVLNLPERCYALDIKGSLLVVATAERHIISYNVQAGAQPREIERTVANDILGKSLRCISAFPDTKGYLVGGIEGRCAIHTFGEPSKEKSFDFQCHRVGKDVFSVNHISFHPTKGSIFATVGGDGIVNIWDKDNKQRLKGFPSVNRTILCAAFSSQGDILAYASSYDWSKGSSFYAPGHPNEIYLHRVTDKELNPSSSKQSKEKPCLPRRK